LYHSDTLPGYEASLISFSYKNKGVSQNKASKIYLQLAGREGPLNLGILHFFKLILSAITGIF
jgi:hypothetical protein